MIMIIMRGWLSVCMSVCMYVCLSRVWPLNCVYAEGRLSWRLKVSVAYFYLFGNDRLRRLLFSLSLSLSLYLSLFLSLSLSLFLMCKLFRATQHGPQVQFVLL